MRYFSCLAFSIGLLIAVTSPGPVQAPPQTNGREALVHQYYRLTHHEQRYREVYARQVKLALAFCMGRPCQPDLDRAIDAAVSEAIAEHEQASIALMAQRLREEDLRAAIAFAQSPAGQAILSADDAMNDQLAAIGHATSRATYAGVSMRFCPSHRDVCLAHGLPVAPAVAKSK